jgi:starch synthase
MADYLIVADAVAPLSDTDAAAGALGLATALAAAGQRVAVVSQAEAAQASRQPGLARRLRMVRGSVGGHPVELPLFEGRPTSSAAHLFLLGAPPADRGRVSALLGSAAANLARDGVFSPSLVIGWGETSASALAEFGSARRIFVLPDGVAGDPLAEDGVEALAEHDDLGAGRSLLARGVMASDAIVVPSPSAEHALSRRAEIAMRASDQPVAVVRLGADDPPHDPATDPTLPAHYSADSLGGRLECRKALVRKLSLAAGPKTLVVGAPLLEEARDGKTLLEALGQLTGLDVAVVLQPGRDRALAERAKLLAIQFPGKIALTSDSASVAPRELLAGVDAMIFTDPADLTARPASLAVRYGTLPIAPTTGAFGDFLVDYDPGSATGTGLLYAPRDAFELVGALRRAIALRASSEVWAALERGLLRAAPRWSGTAAMLETLIEPEAPAAAVAATSAAAAP